jgi:hypothetical protein
MVLLINNSCNSSSHDNSNKYNDDNNDNDNSNSDSDNSLFNVWFVKDWVSLFFMYGISSLITWVTGLKS